MVFFVITIWSRGVWNETWALVSDCWIGVWMGMCGWVPFVPHQSYSAVAISLHAPYHRSMMNPSKVPTDLWNIVRRPGSASTSVTCPAFSGSFAAHLASSMLHTCWPENGPQSWDICLSIHHRRCARQLETLGGSQTAVIWPRCNRLSLGYVDSKLACWLSTL